jgi:hypothetical protein
MKILVSVLFFISLPLFAQSGQSATPPPPSKPANQVPPVPAPPPGPEQQFTQLEQVVANDIGEKQAKLQQEINDFMREVRAAHPGFEFFNGKLVPVTPPPAPDKPEEKKK